MAMNALTPGFRNTDSRPSIDDQASDYDRIWDELSESKYEKQQHFKNRLFAIEWAMRNVAPAGSNVLEVGCGFGTIAGVLTRYGSATGVDLSRRAIDIARDRYPEAKFEAGDITRSTVANRQFDALVTTEVIEHVPRESREQFVAAIANRLVPGGTLILTTPNKQLSDDIETFQMIEEHFFEGELRKLLERHFEILHLTTIHRVFPVRGNKSRVLQAIRAGLYEILQLRRFIESPARHSKRGLYFLVVARKST